NVPSWVAKSVAASFLRMSAAYTVAPLMIRNTRNSRNPLRSAPSFESSPIGLISYLFIKRYHGRCGFARSALERPDPEVVWIGPRLSHNQMNEGTPCRSLDASFCCRPPCSSGQEPSLPRVPPSDPHTGTQGHRRHSGPR